MTTPICRCSVSLEPVWPASGTSQTITRDQEEAWIRGIGKVLLPSSLRDSKTYADAVMDRDMRLTGVFRGQTDNPEAPLGFEVNHPWKARQVILLYRVLILMSSTDGGEDNVRQRLPPHQNNNCTYILTRTGARARSSRVRARNFYYGRKIARPPLFCFSNPELACSHTPISQLRHHSMDSSFLVISQFDAEMFLQSIYPVLFCATRR